MAEPLSARTLDQLFLRARTHKAWRDRPVEEETLRRLYELLRMGPTSANSSPARFLFLTSAEARERLRPALIPGNVEQTMTAPVTAVVAHDVEFHELLPRLYPFTDARSWFTGKAELIRETAFRNGSLQGAYLIMAARSLGLDCGPMSGFDAEAVDREFLAGTSWRSNFLCNLGYGDPGVLHPRAPRLEFEEACRVL